MTLQIQPTETADLLKQIIVLKTFESVLYYVGLKKCVTPESHRRFNDLLQLASSLLHVHRSFTEAYWEMLHVFLLFYIFYFYIFKYSRGHISAFEVVMKENQLLLFANAYTSTIYCKFTPMFSHILFYKFCILSNFDQLVERDRL